MSSSFQYMPGPEQWIARSGSSDLPPRSGEHSSGDRPHLPVTRSVEEVELFLSPFSGMGRMAHVQRQLASVRGVRRVHIGSLVQDRAHFVVTLEPGTSLESLVLANTVIVSASTSKLELSLRSIGARDRSFSRRRGQ